MKETKIKGVYKQKNQLFTKNPLYLKRKKVYNEKIIKRDDSEYRSWNPHRSKLSALILKNTEFEIKPDFNILYLGAATGTTVSHISDILVEGTVFAVENSAVSMKKLLKVCEKRKNIIPIFEDAFHTDRYQAIVPLVDFVYQDISQRNQSQIFIENASRFLKENMKAILMVKARSIDVSLKPKDAYERVCSDLKKTGFKIKNVVNLAPYERDHAAIIIKN